jgi:hypothetical protein
MDFTIFEKGLIAAVKISLERGCFWEGSGGFEVKRASVLNHSRNNF